MLAVKNETAEIAMSAEKKHLGARCVRCILRGLFVV